MQSVENGNQNVYHSQTVGDL